MMGWCRRRHPVKVNRLQFRRSIHCVMRCIRPRAACCPVFIIIHLRRPVEPSIRLCLDERRRRLIPLFTCGGHKQQRREHPNRLSCENNAIRTTNEQRCCRNLKTPWQMKRGSGSIQFISIGVRRSPGMDIHHEMCLLYWEEETWLALGLLLDLCSGTNPFGSFTIRWDLKGGVHKVQKTRTRTIQRHTTMTKEGEKRIKDEMREKSISETTAKVRRSEEYLPKV